MAKPKEELQSTAEINKEAEEGKNVVQVTPTYSTMNVNTTDGLGASNLSEADIKRDLEKAAKALKAKKLKSVSIPKQLQPTLGPTLPACIQGVCVRVPVDGEEYEIPEPFVEVIRNSLKTINSGDVRATLKAGNRPPEDLLTVKNAK
jgi:hypothetical protein